MVTPSLLLTHFAPQPMGQTITKVKNTCKLLDKELQLEPVHLCELFIIFCSDAKLLLESKERESVLHVSAIEKRMHPLWVKCIGKPSAEEGFRKLHLGHGPM